MIQLMIEQLGQRELRDFPPLCTVGRRPDCAVVVSSPNVAAVQARIDRISDNFVLTNLAKTHLVFVNGSVVERIQIIRSGDEITVGDTRIFLLYAEKYSAQPRGPTIQYRCVCQADLIIQSKYAGRNKNCPKCRLEFVVPEQCTTASSRPIQDTRLLAPGKPETASKQNSSLSVERRICPVCQCSVLADDEQFDCSACGLSHHLECWTENQGCSAYGCTQVGVLKQGPDILIDQQGLSDVVELETQGNDLSRHLLSETLPPWEFGFLALSVVASLAGMLTYGIPCLTVGIAAANFAVKRNWQVNIPVLSVAGILNCLGFFIGMISRTNCMQSDHQQNDQI